MAHKSIFFDLDGTLTDSGEGIINCATLALEHFGLSVPTREEMRVFVGPPLDKMFIQHGVPADRVEEAIRVFRSRYVPIGILENYPYPGIRELLEQLKAAGHRLFVATSKPEEMALRVLDRFELTAFFEKICGATLDGSRIEKADVISYLLTQVDSVENTVMVGDTKFDVLGAAEHRIPTIGITWGYGEERDMVDAGAIAIAHTPEDLFTLLNT